ncbi:phosphoinositide 3-kinase adapter protein 1 [Protopterus annectens]|uniref:phosphoinositide 3-kinase adapter protein 1 n=1 Tax=Protopterus annectens TaxID=7888 RepID=UPI001CFADAE9|nr:phosphoinositide 3-kinase adapter protein 1 [Protopterus annectens]
MSGSGSHQYSDVLIVHGCDGEEWSTYLKSLFSSSRYFKNKSIKCYGIKEGFPIPVEQLDIFHESKCIIFLLTGELVNHAYDPPLLKSLQEALGPPHRMFVLFCGVPDSDEFTMLFHDWPLWKKLYCEDDPESYIAAVKQTVSEDSGCESVTDTEDEMQTQTDTRDHTVVIFPKKIRCGEPTKLYIILKCELDSQVKTEVEFKTKQQPPMRIPAIQENKYTVSVNVPNLPSGIAKVTVYSGDLNVCSVQISYYTDMEEISNILKDTTNPMEFMCQAFKIIPCNMDALDKLLTESLKQNIPACGLHVFGISQLEEDLSTSHRDEELPTLLHFAAKYGLKNLTALLLTCPGALQAYSISNKHGDYPNTIAEKNGFKDLRQFIDEYVETADMLKSHIKEELMQREEDETIYEPMVNLSTDLLMKCSLNPGCQEDIYESMIQQVPQHTMDDLYEEMIREDTPEKQAPDLFAETSRESIIRNFLEGKTRQIPKDEDSLYSSQDDLYDEIEKEEYSSQLKRPPAPAPRPKSCSLKEDSEPYISKVFQAKAQPRPENMYIRTLSPIGSEIVRDRPQSSLYDPFAGMKTPGQRQLITLQEQVKLGFITVEDATQQFKEWQFNQKRRSDSFRFQQENLKKLRDSIMRREREKRKAGKDTGLEITEPIRPPRHPNKRAEVGDYNTNTRMSQPSIIMRNWKTESTSSTASSASNRSSVRSTLSISSGAEGDNEDNEIMESCVGHSPRMSDRQPAPLPPGRPPRIPPRLPNRLSAPDMFCGPPVPPRGR